jgi:hypothetical protein
VGIFWKRLVAAKKSGGGLLPFAVAREQLPGSFNRTGFSNSHSNTPATGAADKSAAKIPGSARCGHDNQRESTGGNPPSGQKKPELSCLVPFTPRNNLHQPTPSGDENNTENQSWKCAFN